VNCWLGSPSHQTTVLVSHGEYVAEAIAFLDQTGLKYRLGAMGTEIEGHALRSSPPSPIATSCLPTSPVFAESRPL
jgi:hypothetical protein